MRRSWFVFLFLWLLQIYADNFNIENYPDILNVMNIPSKTSDFNAYCFSDLGNWQGYALPDTNKSRYLGSFIGPFSMVFEKWVSKSILNFQFFRGGEKLDFKKAEKVLHYFPGFLFQNYKFDNIDIKMILFYSTNRMALVKLDIKNLSKDSVLMSIGLKQDIMLKDAYFENKEDSIYLKFNKDFSYFKTVFNNLHITSIRLKEHENYVKLSSFVLSPESNKEIYISQFYFVDKNEDKNIKLNLDNEFYRMKKRWNNYLTGVLENCKKGFETVAVKSLLTLINNWRSAARSLYHDGLFPSYAISYFNGFWAWDSFKHSVVLSLFDTELAKDQVRVMFDFQDSSGMIPDCIYLDSTENNWRNTKPPLATWAVWEIYKKDNDKEFLEEMFPKLLKYHRWWYENRDHDKDMLCEYGSCDGTIIAAAWESGMDNAVRFDSCKILKNNSKAWSLDQESVDLNSYLFYEKGLLSKIAHILGEGEIAKTLSSEAEKIKDLIKKRMFDKKKGYFFDIKYDTEKFVSIYGPEGWIPLWVKLADESQAKSVMQIMMDKNKFNSYVPLPTLDISNKKFNPRGYWRGAIWLDQVYFGIKGLKNYGFDKNASLLLNKVFRNLEGLYSNNYPIRENYNPLNGKGLEANHFSWSAAFLLLMCQNNF